MKLIVEITGFSLLEKIDAEFTGMILEKLSSLLKTEQHTSSSRRGSCFFFNYDTDSGGAGDIARNIILSHRFLSDIAEELRGFVMIAGGSDEKLLLADLFGINGSGFLYIEDGLLEMFRPYGDFVPEGKLYRFSDSGSADITEPGGVLDYIVSSGEYQLFMDRFAPYMNGEKSGVFFFYSEEPCQGLPLMGYALSRNLEGSSAGKMFFPWIHVFPEKSDYCASSPLLRTMDRRFLSIMSGFVTSAEKRIWDDLPISFSHHHPDLPFEEEDGVLMFRIYISAYIRYFKENNMPAVIFLDGVDELYEETAEILAEILKDVPLESGLIPLMFSSRPDVPACFHDFSIYKYRYESCTESNGVRIPSPVSDYHKHLFLKNGLSADSGIRPEQNFPGELGEFAKRMLFLSCITGDFAEPERIIAAVADDDSASVNYKRAYDELVMFGYIYPGRNIPVFSGLFSDPEESAVRAGRIFVESIRRSVSGTMRKDPAFFKKFSDSCEVLGLDRLSREFKLETADLLIDRRNTEKALPMIKDVMSAFRNLGRDFFDMYLYAQILFLKAALTDSRIHLVDDLAGGIFECDAVANEAVEISRSIILSEYYYSKYDFKNALVSAKKALLNSQNKSMLFEESSANTLIGKVMLAMQRIEEAKDYFRISREMISGNDNGILLIKTLYLEAVAHYIYGNVSESLRLLEKGLRLCGEHGIRNWEILCGFLKGRIYFDLGKYHESAGIFSKCLAVDRIYQNTEGSRIVYPWIARSFVYGGSGKEGAAILEDYTDNAEGLLFYSEYLYFEGNFSGALDMAVRALSVSNDRAHPFNSPDFVLNDSGFEYAEDLVFADDAGRGVLHHLIDAFRSFLVVVNGRPAEGIENLMRLTRDERLSDIDPFNGLYYFFHALSLPDKSDNETLDRLTLLSKSLRHVQTVASRIDTPSDRRAFLESSYWNSRLIAACRQNKLL